MADRLVVVLVNNSVAADIRAVQAVPIQGGWGNGVVRGNYRLWSPWASTFIAGTRAGLVSLRDAGRCRLLILDDDSRERHQAFLERVSTEASRSV